MSETPPPSIGVDLVRASVSGVPWVGSPLEIILTGIYERRRYRAQQALQPGLEVAGSVDELIVRMQADEIIDVLVADAISTATSTALESKRLLLGRALANAIGDAANVDESQLLISTLQVLDAPHVNALQRMRAVRVGFDQHDVDINVWQRMKEAEQAVWVKEPPPVGEALIATGTAVDPPITYAAGSRPERGLTDFGVAFLDDLAACAPNET